MKREPYSKKTFLKGIFLGFFIIPLCLTSCSKKLEIKPIAVEGSKDWIVPYAFDWENPSDLMPTPSNKTIYVPWAYGVTGSITSTYDADVYSDHKKSDGWVLVYSTFSPYTYTPMPYFILYNKYRGLLRIYQYNDNTGYTYSSNLQANAQWSGNGNSNYSQLNFAGKTLIDVFSSATQQKVISTLEPAPTDGSYPVTPNTWYMLQYEITYDPNLVATTSSTPPTFSWNVNYRNITQVSLGGTLTGKITGTVGSSTLEQNVNSALGKGLTNIGTVALSAVGAKFFETNKMGLNNTLYSNIKKGVDGALSTATGNIPATVVSIFSAIFGGNSNGQTYNLDLNASLSLNGTLENNGSLFSGTSIPMPGSIKPVTDGSYNISGFVPLYNKTLGVFNLSNRPVIKSTYNAYPTYMYPAGTQAIRLNIDNTSFSIKFNPELLSIATIQNMRQEVVVFPYNFYPGDLVDIYAKDESGGSKSVYVHAQPIIFVPYGFPYGNNFKPGFMGVRIAFTVVPKDGSPSSTIIKTFVADWNCSN
ncbi:MAG TPA: hypothetical protein VIH57_06125 [Bacteroidales bacterium]